MRADKIVSSILLIACVVSCKPKNNSVAAENSYEGKVISIDHHVTGKRVGQGEWINIDGYIFKHNMDPLKYTETLNYASYAGDTLFIPAINELVRIDNRVLKLPAKRSGMYISNRLFGLLSQIKDRKGLSLYRYNQEDLLKYSILVLYKTDGSAIKIKTSPGYHATVKVLK